MKVFSSKQVSKSCSDNQKSKIQNPKWVGLFAIVVTLTVCRARVDAQQAGKIFRIGFLDISTASGSAVRLQAFWQEYAGLAGSRERILPSSTDLQRGKVTVYLSLPRTWFVLRLI